MQKDRLDTYWLVEEPLASCSWPGRGCRCGMGEGRGRTWPVHWSLTSGEGGGVNFKIGLKCKRIDLTLTGWLRSL